MGKLLDVVLGARCMGCGSPGSTWCRTCTTALEVSPCQPNSCCLDSGVAAKLVRAGKYGHAHGAAQVMARWTQQRFPDLTTTVDYVTWVPADRDRRRARGGYLPERYARALARHAGVPCLSLLMRASGYPPQRGLDRTARKYNAQQSFSLNHRTIAHRVLTTNDGAVNHPGNHAPRVLLLDDIRTTGATLNTCSQLLEQSGLSVSVLAFCSVQNSIAADWEKSPSQF